MALARPRRENATANDCVGNVEASRPPTTVVGEQYEVDELDFGIAHSGAFYFTPVINRVTYSRPTILSREFSLINEGVAARDGEPGLDIGVPALAFSRFRAFSLLTSAGMGHYAILFFTEVGKSAGAVGPTICGSGPGGFFMGGRMSMEKDQGDDQDQDHSCEQTQLHHGMMKGRIG